MIDIVPTVTAYDLHEYRTQLERVSGFTKRIHVDLMDGQFAPTKSPDIQKLWLPSGIKCDIHLMFLHPDRQVERVRALNPSMIIVQVEANQESVRRVITGLKKTKTKVGVSLLAPTSPRDTFAEECIRHADYVLIFSGHLGYHGGTADLTLLYKIEQIKALNPEAEIAWDGGITLDNSTELVAGGVTVLNVGSTIQKAQDPRAAYIAMTKEVAKESKR